MNFADRMQEAVARCGNAALVGLDPHAESLPEEFAAVRAPGASRAERARACADFLCQVIELAAGLVPAVKPQSAFFELYGADGAAAWERVVAAARAAGLLVIGDVKRGDIDTTAKAYARAFLDPACAGEAHCDAITVNPYLGADAVQPFVEACRAHDAGLFVLVRTSNKNSGLFQDHGTPRLYEQVARAVDAWGSELVGQSGLSSIGAVVGATHPAELAALRKLLPRTPFLIPGYGAQGAGAAEIAGGFLAGGRGALVNSSRGILFACKQPRHAGRPWKDATRAALAEMTAELRALAR
jgi:orotidine-5'-phosphate decarboxylase